MSMQWYIIHTYSGFEKKVKESLESRVAAFSLQDKIGRVLIPMEDVMEMRGGKKVVSSRMSYQELRAGGNGSGRTAPSAGIVRQHATGDRICRFGDFAVAAFRSGSGRNYQPRAHTAGSSEAESGIRTQRAEVRIVDGPFANFNGTVEEIDGMTTAG